jgi:hypothetical protein
MKKLLFIAVLAVTAISCDKDKDDNTNSIEGRWTMTENVMTVNMVATMGGMTIIDSSYTETSTGADLEGAGIEFLSNGSAIFFDEDGNDDTASYSYSNNMLSITTSQFSFDEMDTTLNIPVSNLTSNTMDWNFTLSMSESDFGFTSTSTIDTRIKFIK